MSDPKRHHYVPQFHLRRFGFGDGNGQIHRFDKTDGSIARASVKGSAYEDDYYTRRITAAVAEAPPVVGPPSAVGHPASTRLRACGRIPVVR